MGCCLSRDAPGSPYPTNGDRDQHSDSSRAINSTTENTSSNPLARRHSLSRHASDASTPYPSQSDRRRRQLIPLSEHYNQPIHPHVWHSKRRLWSKPEIARERKEFFETRVTGKPEVWAALQLAVSLVRSGDIATAQGVIDAAGVTVPTGDFCDGCYDENGALYRLPHVIVSDPTNIVADGEDNERIEADDEQTNSKLGVDMDSDYEIEEVGESRHEEKGKKSERDTIRVRARLSDRDGPDLEIPISKEQSVGTLVKKIETEIGLARIFRLRIAYLGKILKENESLLVQGWKEGHVVNALVIHRPQ
ncbi:hypothetical protein LOZ12_005222 [Ophidiomyces ophidiicola]|uniref:Uncharacterized protein n=1 Tax=Ophidiomyces ophidiicola TaxID=1387563 RepID=A0ACB8UZK0_9EURO|nr:uncharacterized protein LOZ57_000196 [Ophidiomyces ophidiicola]KAI1907777.1 hypothetical protein LOZ61_005939 [Ophidiomyces ophidiicola]KAI1909109.1 hypothetical protein LOZ64_005340 [Ophidiomyces ophidiicola]KAI1922376.1 hypothetical protein LOZ60_005704 [Ophidiomyces ophidiicola]KAI1937811.1 hypothetical protein LOZ62_005407 [Ophidiomyces ophidiicola]KAI1953855.1 hypothetical protein LOZ57_000196 [Ophidiomyces ophidiicola]